MNLGEIRAQCELRHGRSDLVNVDGSDNGMDYFINAAQRWLDRISDTNKAVARLFKTVTAGQWYQLFQYCRAVKEVWMANTEGRWQLKKLSVEDFRATYTEPWTEMDAGQPQHYCLGYFRAAPESVEAAIEDLGGILGYADIMFGEHFLYNGILWAPKPEESYTLEVWGLFHTNELTEDTDVSFWSVANPEILILATGYVLELHNRNTQGAQDYMGAVMSLLRGLDYDVVEQDIAEVDQMEG